MNVLLSALSFLIFYIFSEFIVTYKRFLSPSDRLNLLRSTFEANGGHKWSLGDRSPIANKTNSDFDVIKASLNQCLVVLNSYFVDLRFGTYLLTVYSTY